MGLIPKSVMTNMVKIEGTKELKPIIKAFLFFWVAPNTPIITEKSKNSSPGKAIIPRSVKEVMTPNDKIQA